MKHLKTYESYALPVRLDFKKDYPIHRESDRSPYKVNGFKITKLNSDEIRKNSASYADPRGIVFLTDEEASKLSEWGDEYQKKHELEIKQFNAYVSAYHRLHYKNDPKLKESNPGVKFKGLDD